ncbi:hypothetical protein [Nostoc sp.]|uniref:hypothetical protein n=1 Tax=Nostoc sp. TaxID=1180 RepID=UPI002FF963A0
MSPQATTFLANSSEEALSTMAYTLKDSWTGNEFIKGNEKGDKWSFFHQPDPTHGQVNYGKWNELIKIVDGKIKIEVESEGYKPGAKRKSIRIYTEKKYNEGLFIIDLDHIPEGMAVWPAIWLVGTGVTWPENGEIDIIEGVNSTPSKHNRNHSTLHTKKGCVQNIPNIINPDCNADNGALGCGVTGPENSFGHRFNQNHGGAYVCEWVHNQTIKIWFWKRSDIPANVLGNSPHPNTWGKPYVHFNPCPGYFKDMEMIVNTTLCGDWAGNDFKGGIDKCNGYVSDANNNPKFKDAYFLIRSVRVFMP